MYDDRGDKQPFGSVQPLKMVEIEVVKPSYMEVQISIQQFASEMTFDLSQTMDQSKEKMQVTDVEVSLPADKLERELLVATTELSREREQILELRQQWDNNANRQVRENFERLHQLARLEAQLRDLQRKGDQWVHEIDQASRLGPVARKVSDLQEMNAWIEEARKIFIELRMVTDALRQPVEKGGTQK